MALFLVKKKAKIYVTDEEVDFWASKLTAILKVA